MIPVFPRGTLNLTPLLRKISPTGDFRGPVTTQRRPANILRRAALCVPNRPAICDGVDLLIGCNLPLQSGTAKPWLVLRFYARQLNLRSRAAYKE